MLLCSLTRKPSFVQQRIVHVTKLRELLREELILAPGFSLSQRGWLGLVCNCGQPEGEDAGTGRAQSMGWCCPHQRHHLSLVLSEPS